MQSATGERKTSTAGGLLLVDKPAGVTSHDVVAHCRRAVASKRVGHAGTLDPFATGLLVIGVGQATRLLPYLDGEPKVYEARIRFGFETNTDDSTGIATITGALPDWDRLPGAIAALTGTIAQVPPAFSAKHVNGERAYAMARRGENVDLASVNITVHEWQVISQAADTLSVVITCAGGTYVRALARDLGRQLASAAHCDALRRTRSGACDIRDAVSVNALVRGALADGAITLRSPIAALQEMARVSVSAVEEFDIRNGRSIEATQAGMRAVLIDAGGAIVGIANRSDSNRWQPRVVLPTGAGE
jgi:tRNA pseudouridine55 synthase